MTKQEEEILARCAGLIALKFYQDITKRDIYYSRDNTLETILKTIINGSYELKTELNDVITEILKNKWKNHRDPYYDLAKFILTKSEGLHICGVLPNEVLKLADLYWYVYTKRKSCVSELER